MYASINTTTSSFYLQPDLRCPFGFMIDDVSQQNHIGFHHPGQSPCATTPAATPGFITLPDLQEDEEEEEEMVNKSAEEECKHQSKKVVVKKERHSKIVTAQGLRDRRVRLSIGISRKFFDLQDMLGFDKASKTVEWLFTKSQNAINEMMMEKIRFNAANSGYQDFDMETKAKMKEATTRKARIQGFSKEKRRMAREKARIRTQEKLCARRKLDDGPKKYSNSGNCQKAQGNLKQSNDKSVSELPSREDFNEELKSSSSILNYQAKNWDISSVVTQSRFRAQMNLSAEIQVYGKQWKGVNNHQKSTEVQDIQGQLKPWVHAEGGGEIEEQWPWQQCLKKMASF